MKIAVQCRMGLGKKICEDHALVFDCACSQMRLFNSARLELETDEPVIVAVADGVGGNPGAHQASRFSLSVLCDLAGQMLAAGTPRDLEPLLVDLNSRLLAYAAELPGLETMATTFSALCAADGRCRLLHTGNTRISLMFNRYIKQATTDFTTYQHLLDMGLTEAAERCNRSEIISCLGGGTPRSLSRIEARDVYQEGKRPHLMLLTSDGIHEYVDLDWLEDLMNDEAISDLEKTDRMISQALDNGSMDDKTAVIVRI